MQAISTEERPCALCGAMFDPEGTGRALCPQCMGVPRYPLSVVQDPANIPEPPGRKVSKTRQCRSCGRTESDGATFYPSTPSQCRECHTAKQQARWSHPGNKPLDAGVVDDAVVTPAETQAFDLDMAVCKSCGTAFEPYKVGRGLVKVKCMKCRIEGLQVGRRAKFMREKAMPAPKINAVVPIKDLPENCVVLDFTRFPWALEWLRESLACTTNTDGNPGGMIVREICEKVPAEWLKDHLLNGGTSL